VVSEGSDGEDVGSYGNSHDICVNWSCRLRESGQSGWLATLPQESADAMDDDCKHLDLGVYSLEHEPVWKCRDCKQTVRLKGAKAEFAHQAGLGYGQVATEDWIRTVMTMKNQQGATPDTDPQPYGGDPEHLAHMRATDPHMWSFVTGVCFACGAEIGREHSCDGLTVVAPKLVARRRIPTPEERR
jgi:hypothetical protein